MRYIVGAAWTVWFWAMTIFWLTLGAIQQGFMWLRGYKYENHQWVNHQWVNHQWVKRRG